MLSEYDHGFKAGLEFVISCLRRAADKVERPIYSDFERKSDGSIYRGIARSSSVHFASQLRAVAAELEATLHTVL